MKCDGRIWKKLSLRQKTHWVVGKTLLEPMAIGSNVVQAVGGERKVILGGIPHPNGAIVEELSPILKSPAH